MCTVDGMPYGEEPRALAAIIMHVKDRYKIREMFHVGFYVAFYVKLDALSRRETEESGQTKNRTERTRGRGGKDIADTSKALIHAAEWKCLRHD